MWPLIKASEAAAVRTRSIKKSTCHPGQSPWGSPLESDCLRESGDCCRSPEGDVETHPDLGMGRRPPSQTQRHRVSSEPTRHPGGGGRASPCPPRGQPWGRWLDLPTSTPRPALGAVARPPCVHPDTGLHAGEQSGLPTPLPQLSLFSSSAPCPPLSSRVSVRSKAALRSINQV